MWLYYHIVENCVKAEWKFFPDVCHGRFVLGRYPSAIESDVLSALQHLAESKQRV